MAKIQTKRMILWKDEPDAHDYPAAAAYLSLLADDAVVARLIAQLQATSVQHGKAKDLLRAARLALLPADDAEVAKDLAKIRLEQPLSPVLLVRGELAQGLALQIADGYHRVCASYHAGENSNVPYRLATLDHSA